MVLAIQLMICRSKRWLGLVAVLGFASPMGFAQLPTLPTLIDSITGQSGPMNTGYSLDGFSLGVNKDGSTFYLDKWAAAAITIDANAPSRPLHSVQVIVRPENPAAWAVQHPDMTFQVWAYIVPQGRKSYQWWPVAATSVYTKPNWGGTSFDANSPGVPLTFTFEQEYALTYTAFFGYRFALNLGDTTGNYVMCQAGSLDGYTWPMNVPTQMDKVWVTGERKPATASGVLPDVLYDVRVQPAEGYPLIIINPQFVPEPIAYPLGLGGVALGAVLVRRIRRGRA